MIFTNEPMEKMIKLRQSIPTKKQLLAIKNVNKHTKVEHCREVVEETQFSVDAGQHFKSFNAYVLAILLFQRFVYENYL